LQSTTHKQSTIIQTILGSGGAIGENLAAELIKYTSRIRLVSRNPRRVNSTDKLMPGDLLQASFVDKAVEGAEVVYLTVGLQYNIKVWRQQWPAIMQNVIDACKKHNSRLVFFDNVYMYDCDFMGDMTEENLIRPTSRKGEVRARIEAMLRNEMAAGNITALIARSADFIGPKNSVLVEMVYKNFIKGKKANWFNSADKIHSFTNVIDAARGTAILGNTPEAFGSVWHLPTSPQKLTGRQWVELFAAEMKVKPECTVLPNFMLGLIGLFVPIMNELKEMSYQYDRNYFFNSNKFNQRFSYTPISAEQGIKDLVQLLGSEKVS